MKRIEHRDSFIARSQENSNLVETNYCRTISKLKNVKLVRCQDFLLKSFIIAILLQSVHNDRADENAIKFKISPTRIRLTSVGFRTNKYTNADSNEIINRDNLPNENLKLIDYKLPKKRRQMAPAYELWPDYSLESNRMGSLSRSRLGIESHAVPLSLEKQSQYYQASRNMLPNPLFASESSNRVIIVRSTEEDEDSDKNPHGENEQDEAEPAENSSSERDPVSQNHSVLDSDDAMERAESRKLEVSQVYPPGDLDRLYSDALLVYVKDFNQYIKK